MTVSTSSSPVQAKLVERGRRVMYGYLGPMILHETNNVLTVMAGLRQLLRAGHEVPERIGGMIDDQLDRVDEMLTGLRSVGSDEAEDSQGRSLEMVLDALKKLLALASKARKVTLTTEAVGEVPLPVGSTEPLAVALLCTLLPMIPPRSSKEAVDMKLRAGHEAERAFLSAKVNLSSMDLDTDLDVATAREILSAYGGTFEWVPSADARGVEIHLRWLTS